VKEKRDWTTLLFSSGGVIALLGLATTFYFQTSAPEFRGLMTEQARCEIARDLALADNPNLELRAEDKAVLDTRIGGVLPDRLKSGVQS
jgi:hypothetical protein